MKRVAVTGNIGSGKSTVCRIFESLGIQVYFADSEAKKFYGEAHVAKAVKALFGDDVYGSGNHLQNSILAKRAFQDQNKLTKLNNIIHPLVLEDYLAWAASHSDKNYTLYESALLFESGFYRHFHRSILVTAPVEIACARVIARDSITKAEFNKRLARQWDEQKKSEMADHLVINNLEKPLIPQVIALHNILSAS
ncbi:MAG: dephospho-CoA kinase [Bacteroidales bacterium]|nr:dephospho-CoA kinase [Bacteroidales bacterium]